MKKRIKQFLRPVIQRNLSPKTVQALRFQLWLISSYYPRLIGSRIVKRRAKVRAFGGTRSSLVEELRAVNLMSPQETCLVMAKWGSDKARNEYTPLYSALFRGRFDRPLRIVELGLGTNNPEMLSSMGVFGAPGASLRGWRQLFPHALVYGADVDRGILFEEDRIKTFYCDQLNRSSILELWSQEELRRGAEIIIEDGLHTFEANISFLDASLPHLQLGGIYVVEDVGWDSFEQWNDRIESIYLKQYPTYEFAFVVLSDRGYNNLLVIRRMPDKPKAKTTREGSESRTEVADDAQPSLTPR